VDIADLLSCPRNIARKSFSIWKPRNNIRPNVETSPTRPILYTSQKNLSHQGQLAGISAPSRPHKIICPVQTAQEYLFRPGNFAALCPTLETSGYTRIFPIIETWQGQLSHTANLTGIAVPFLEQRKKSRQSSEIRRCIFNHGKLARKFVLAWKPRRDTSHPRNQAGLSIPSWKPRGYNFPIMETSQGYNFPIMETSQGQLSDTGNVAATYAQSWTPTRNICQSLHSRTPSSPTSPLGPHNATGMATVTIEINSTKTSSLQFSVT
jgi:hypothetical protein